MLTTVYLGSIANAVSAPRFCGQCEDLSKYFTNPLVQPDGPDCIDLMQRKQNITNDTDRSEKKLVYR